MRQTRQRIMLLLLASSCQCLLPSPTAKNQTQNAIQTEDMQALVHNHYVYVISLQKPHAVILDAMNEPSLDVTTGPNQIVFICKMSRHGFHQAMLAEGSTTGFCNFRNYQKFTSIAHPANRLHCKLLMFLV